MNKLFYFKVLFWLTLCFFCSSNLKAQKKFDSEKEYSIYIQSLIGGEREYHIENGRVDLVTKDFAFEIERANNWKEAIGQSDWRHPSC